MSVAEEVETQETSYIDDRNKKWYSHFEKPFGNF